MVVPPRNRGWWMMMTRWSWIKFLPSVTVSCVKFIRYFWRAFLDGFPGHSTCPCSKFSSSSKGSQRSRLQSRSVETYVLCFLRPAAQATRPLSCGQNAAYRQDRQRWLEWPKWQCTFSSSTQTMWKNHHAADAEVNSICWLFASFM